VSHLETLNPSPTLAELVKKLLQKMETVSGGQLAGFVPALDLHA